MKTPFFRLLPVAPLAPRAALPARQTLLSPNSFAAAAQVSDLGHANQPPTPSHAN